MKKIPSFLYVADAASNIKRGVCVSLQPKTLIIGGNGTGKTSILNTIELCLTGSISDVGGKEKMARGIEIGRAHV